MKQVIPVTGVVNTDIQPKMMPLGQSTAISMMEDGRYYGRGGSLVTKRGTLNTGTILINGEVVIGTCPWVERNRLVYFVYSDLGDHFIGFYDFGTNTHTKLIYVFQAGFDPAYPIVHAEVIDNVLWWTEGKFEGFYTDNGTPLYTPPFRLNLERAENGEYGISADLQTIDVIKYPSPFSPTWIYQSIPSLNYNYLRGKLYQFRVQYVYEDGEESVWSPISKMEIPTSGGFINNTTEPFPDQNVIRLVFNTGHFTATQIKIAVSVNQGQFGVFKTLDKVIEGIPSNTDYVLNYTGDTSYQAVELDTRNYDNVPLVANCVSKLVDEICYTNIIRGYDRLVPDVAIEYPITELEGYKLNVHRLTAAKTSLNLITLSWSNAATLDALEVQEGDYYSFQLRFSGGGESGVSLSYYVTDAVIAQIYAAPTPQAGRNILISRIGQAYVDIIVNAGGSATGALVGNTYEITLASVNDIIGSLPETGFRPERLQNTAKTLKKGGKYKWYIQYYDRGNRDGTALTSEAMEARVPFVTDQDLSSLSYAGAPYKVLPRFTINHIPPVWATHYQILVAKDNGITDFQQTTITKLDVQNDGNYLLSLQNLYEQVYKGAVISHQIKKGDRVRFMATGVEQANSPTPVNYTTNYFECEVMQYDPAGGVNGAPAIYVQRFDLALIDWNTNKGIQVEIYTPSVDSDVERIFEIGEEFEIINPYRSNRAHAGNVQNQTSTLPAILSLDYGDVYIRTRMLGTGYDFPQNVFYYYCEDPNYSDFYVSNFNSRGRVAIENVNAKTDRYNISVHGGKYLKENNLSNVNNLCRFEFGDNTQEYDPQYGFVTRTLVDGKTLKVLQPQKEVSVYLNGTYAVTGDGIESPPAFSTKVFGGFRPYDSLYGCSDGRLAILVPRMGVFYFDSSQKEFIYSLNNGQKRVSLDGMNMTRSAEFARLLGGDNMLVSSFIESELGKVGFNVSSELGGMTLTYNYDGGHFAADHVNKPVWFYGNLADKLVAFSTNRNAYLYNVDGAITFHGDAYQGVLEIITNDPAIQKKVFQNIQYQGRKGFDIECEIEADDTYGTQETEMAASLLELLEGYHFVQVRMNANTGTIKTPSYYMVNGDPMRGDYMKIRFKATPVSGQPYPEISVVIAEYFPSEILNA